jgi:hypothetical protein
MDLQSGLDAIEDIAKDQPKDREKIGSVTLINKKELH